MQGLRYREMNIGTISRFLTGEFSEVSSYRPTVECVITWSAEILGAVRLSLFATAVATP